MINAGHYTLFRVLLGGYLVVHFLMLVPFGTEVFSSAGMLGDAAASPLIRAFPNILGLYDAPWFVTTLLASGALAGVMIAAGRGDRIAAFVAFYVLACLFGRNPLIANPALPYVGWMLLLHACVPAAPRSADDGAWQLPRELWIAAWVVLALSYSYSGFTKLLSPSWVSGDTVSYVLDNPLARDWFVTDLFRLLDAQAPWLIKGLTWIILYVELLFAPLALSSRLRPWLWGIMLVVQFGFLTLLNFADLTFPMLLVHLLTFDPRWLPQRLLQGEPARA